jgi:hypothetical protein
MDVDVGARESAQDEAEHGGEGGRTDEAPALLRQPSQGN